MGKKSKTPEAPDPSVLINNQNALNDQYTQQNLQNNRVNQTNPFGSLTWSQDENGNWTQNVGLTGAGQYLLDQQQGNQAYLGEMQNYVLRNGDFAPTDLFGDPRMAGREMPGMADYSSLQAAPGAVNYAAALGELPKIGQYNQQATDLYNQLAAPGLEKQRAAKEAQMAAMGLSLGSGQAYNGQQELLNESENRSGMMGAQAGIQQGNTMFNQALAARGQRAGELGQQWQQGMAGRQQGVNELNNLFNQGMGIHQQGVSDILAQKQANMANLQGLMGLGQQIGSPQFAGYNTVQSQAPSVAGAAGQGYQGQLNSANAANADKANTMSTVGTVVGAAAAIF